MLYAILIHGNEAAVDGWSPQEEGEVLGRHTQLREDLAAAGKLGPSIRLGPTAATKMFRRKSTNPVTDGPFAETKEQLLGLYVIECATPDEALAAAERLAFDTAAIEIRPIDTFLPGGLSTG